MKCWSLAIIFTILSFQISALTVPEDHFLYPRDYEALWISGIEAPLRYRSLVRNLENCDDDSPWRSKFRIFHCEFREQSVLKEVEVSYSERFFADVTFFGETHTNQLGQNYVAAVIKEAPTGYFKTLALEMFNEWTQSEIDQLIKTDAPLSEWRELLTSQWGYSPEGYLKVIEAALESGMRIIALDDRRKERGFDHDDDFSEDLIYRDQVMTRNLITELKMNPGERIIALTGKLHSFRRLSDERISIAELVQDKIPEVKTKHFMLFPHKRSHFIRSHFPLQSPPYRVDVSQKLLPYADFLLMF